MKENVFIGQIKEQPLREKMDLKDRKILYLLNRNARFSDTMIAKTLKLKREVVSYRIKKLIERNILHGFLTLINPIRLGFRIHIVYLKLKELKDVNEVIDYFVNLKEVSRLQNCSGAYDLQIMFSTKDISDFNNVFEGIISKLSDTINDYLIVEIIEENFLGLQLLLNNEERKEMNLNPIEFKGSSFQKDFLNIKKTNNTIKIDEKDKMLLEFLVLNARISIIELSKKLNLSVTSIENRIKNLIKDGVIKAFIPYISLAHLGYQWYNVCFQVKNINEKKFISYLENNTNVPWCTKMVGKWNYQFSIFARDNTEFNLVLNQIRSEFIDNIVSHNSMIIFNQFKFVHRLE